MHVLNHNTMQLESTCEIVISHAANFHERCRSLACEQQDSQRFCETSRR